MFPSSLHSNNEHLSFFDFRTNLAVVFLDRLQSFQTRSEARVRVLHHEVRFLLLYRLVRDFLISPSRVCVRALPLREGVAVLFSPLGFASPSFSGLGALVLGDPQTHWFSSHSPLRFSQTDRAAECPGPAYRAVCTGDLASQLAVSVFAKTCPRRAPLRSTHSWCTVGVWPPCRPAIPSRWRAAKRAMYGAQQGFLRRLR